MRYSDLPKYIQIAWKDRKVLDAIADDILETFRKKGEPIARLVTYLKRIYRQLDALRRGAELLATRLSWKRTKIELETYRAILEGYQKEKGASKGSTEHKDAQEYFSTLIENAKGYHRKWISWKKDGQHSWERLPLLTFRRLLRGIEDIQGTPMPDGGKRYLWEAPEYRQFISAKPAKVPAWLTVENDYQDEYTEEEDGEE